MEDWAGESDGQPAAPAIPGIARRSGRATVAPTANITVQVYSGFDSLPERLIAFLDAAAGRSFFYSIPWFRMLLRTAGPRGDKPRIYAAESRGRPVAVLIL